MTTLGAWGPHWAAPNVEFLLGARLHPDGQNVIVRAYGSDYLLHTIELKRDEPAWFRYGNDHYNEPNPRHRLILELTEYQPPKPPPPPRRTWTNTNRTEKTESSRTMNPTQDDLDTRRRAIAIVAARLDTAQSALPGSYLALVAVETLLANGFSISRKLDE